MCLLSIVIALKGQLNQALGIALGNGVSNYPAPCKGS